MLMILFPGPQDEGQYLTLSIFVFSTSPELSRGFANVFNDKSYMLTFLKINKKIPFELGLISPS